jgi:putative oxidoreductase
MSLAAGLGLLLIRIVLGLTFAAHGAQKLFGWFGGQGLDKTAEFFESVGVKPGKTMGVLGGLGELAGGLLFAIGFLTPLSALLITITMLVAIFTAHAGKGYWNANNGWEYNFLIIVTAIGVACIGPGLYSVDYFLF